MNYIIEELTKEEQENHPSAVCKLVEQGFNLIILGFYDTKVTAHLEQNKWKYRGELQEKIGDFYAEMEENYGTVLDVDEITEMIKAYN